VAATPDGGFLIADQNNHRVRHVSPTGTITTVAGTTVGMSGDGGPATAAQLSFPFGVAVTADGGFLITDRGNDRVRRVSPTGTITTVAGTSIGPAGDGGPATAAQLNRPTGVAVTADGGFLIADWGNHRIRFVDADLRGPASGPQGPQGQQGPRGTSTVQKPPRQPAASPVRLAFALATARLHARPRQRITLRYAATTTATIDLAVLRGRRHVAGVHATAHAGRNLIRLRAPARPGRYRLQVLATTSDGQRATDRARLTVIASRHRR
jgi:hypothetical protein